MIFCILGKLCILFCKYYTHFNKNTAVGSGSDPRKMLFAACCANFSDIQEISHNKEGTTFYFALFMCLKTICAGWCL